MRLSRLTDYGIVLLSHFAKYGSDKNFTARELAEKSGLPLPTVSKLLKTLTRSKLIVSRLGVKGGYTIAKHPSLISVAEMIAALEGPISVTDCALAIDHACEFELDCPSKSPWQRINSVMQNVLQDLSLADMVANKEPQK